MRSMELDRLRAQMQNRYVELKPELDAGVIGLSSDGFVAVREPDRVPFADRPRLRALVANEDADRSALSRQIAVSKREPGWQTPLRAVFTQRRPVFPAHSCWRQAATENWQTQPQLPQPPPAEPQRNQPPTT